MHVIKDQEVQVVYNLVLPEVGDTIGGVVTQGVGSCNLKRRSVLMDIMWPISQSHFNVSCLCSLK